MECLNCMKEFELLKEGSGGSNRIFCYECMPFNSDRGIRQKQRYDLLLKYSDKLKLDKGCKKCGYKKCARALDWHHPNSVKDDNPSSILRLGLKKYLNETNKCDVLCSNCHREWHYILSKNKNANYIDWLGE